MFWTIVNTVAVLLTLVLLCAVLYKPSVQRSDAYQATVVPLANIMDVGFLAMTPLIVVLTGVDSPLFMFQLVVLGLAMGWVMRYNIEYYEPHIGEGKLLNKISSVSRWMLIAASLVNIAYYLQLLATLLLAPLGVGNQAVITTVAVGLLITIMLVGMLVGLQKLDSIGQKTTAFNIASIAAVLVGFLAFNFQMVITGQWHLPEYNPPESVENQRKLLGFFAIVQGFEASRYMRERYGQKLRIATMRRAQLISGVVFVVLIASSLILFVKLRPEMNAGAVIQLGKLVTPVLPFVILATALGGQLSASVNAVSSRSDLLIEATHGGVTRRTTFPLLIVPCIVVAVLTDVQEAIAYASRVFAAYYVLQCLIAAILGIRQRKFLRVAVTTLISVAMLIIALFSLPA